MTSHPPRATLLSIASHLSKHQSLLGNLVCDSAVSSPAGLASREVHVDGRLLDLLGRRSLGQGELRLLSAPTPSSGTAARSLGSDQARLQVSDELRPGPGFRFLRPNFLLGSLLVVPNGPLTDGVRPPLAGRGECSHAGTLMHSSAEFRWGQKHQGTLIISSLRPVSGRVRMYLKP